MSSIVADQQRPLYARGWGEGCGVLANKYSCAHRAQKTLEIYPIFVLGGVASYICRQNCTQDRAFAQIPYPVLHKERITNVLPSALQSICLKCKNRPNCLISQFAYTYIVYHGKEGRRPYKKDNAKANFIPTQSFSKQDYLDRNVPVKIRRKCNKCLELVDVSFKQELSFFQLDIAYFWHCLFFGSLLKLYAVYILCYCPMHLSMSLAVLSVY